MSIALAQVNYGGPVAHRCRSMKHSLSVFMTGWRMLTGVLVVALLMLMRGESMAITLVQTATASGVGTGPAQVTLSSPCGQGHLLLVMVWWENRSYGVTSVTDLAGNTYDKGFPSGVGGGITTPAPNGSVVGIWVAPNVRPTTTITVTFEWSGSKAWQVKVSEWDGHWGWTEANPMAAGSAAIIAPPYDADGGTTNWYGTTLDCLYVALEKVTTPGVQIDSPPAGSTLLHDGSSDGFYAYSYIGVMPPRDPFTQPLSLDGASDLGYNVAGFLEYPLDVWVDIPNFHGHEWLNASEYPGGAARFLCDLWTTDGGVMIKARLVSLLADDATIDAVVGTSAEVTATVPTDASFAVVLAGLKQHKLQVTSNPTDTDLWCAPGAKVLP